MSRDPEFLPNVDTQTLFDLRRRWEHFAHDMEPIHGKNNPASQAIRHCSNELFSVMLGMPIPGMTTSKEPAK